MKLKSPLENFIKWESTKEKETFLIQPINGKNYEYSWGKVGEEARKICNYINSLNLPKHSKIAILSKNCAHWIIADLAIMMSGNISVPIYANVNGKTAKYILEHSESKLLFVGKLEESDWNQIESHLPNNITKVDFGNYDLDCDYEKWDNIISDYEPIKTLNKINLDSIITIIYTSGTTGNPKGVMLSHGGILSNCEGAREILDSLVKKDQPVFLTWLPLSHSYEHTVQYVQISLGAKVYYAESLEKLLTNMNVAKPTIMTAVPRFYQNLYSKISINFLKQKGFKKKLIENTILLGTKTLNNEILNFNEKIINFLCEKLVRKKIKNQFGGRLKAFVSGGGALDQKIGEFLNSIGLPTLQGYGLTETSPVVSCNIPGKIKIETVGPPFKTNNVKIANDGEILVKGENVMLGYWNMKKETEEVIKNGWLHTGDIGEITKDGNLKITDRKKEIIVNLGGDNISPSKIENLLSLQEKIKQSFIYGDKKTYLVALIVTESLENKKEIEFYIENLNKTLSSVEKVKKFKLINEEFTIENGMLTPTMKLKRKKILKKYKEDLEKLY